MSAVRLVGCLCVAAFTALWCFSYAASLRSRLKALERAVRFVSVVRREIEYYETPFPEIVRRFAEDEGMSVDASEGTYAERCAALRTGDDVAAIRQMMAKDLDEDDGRRFSEFFDKVGASYTEAELRLCDETEADLSSRLAARRAEFTRQRRVNTSLAVFFAASVCIVIL